MTATTRAERITNLDTVRGIATLGILVMNAVAFALVDPAYFNLDADGSETWLDWTLGVLGEIFVDQKTMALFSLLFGVGIVVFADRAEAKGKRPVRLSLWRNLLLFGIGILHTLLWEGDVLVVYALCAPVLLILRKRSPRILAIAGTTLVLSSAVLALVTQASIEPSVEELGSMWFEGGGDGADATALFLLYDFFARALGMMLIGVALFRWKVVQGQLPARQYRKMVAAGLAVGLPLSTLGVMLQFSDGWAGNYALSGLAPNTLATIPLTLAYLGAISLWNQRQTTSAHERLRAVGRMALTNYLAQTVLGALVFWVVLDGVAVTRSEIWLFILCVWTAQLLWSRAWLRRFQFGPVEWIWRCLTYRKLQPITR